MSEELSYIIQSYAPLFESLVALSSGQSPAIKKLIPFFSRYVSCSQGALIQLLHTSWGQDDIRQEICLAWLLALNYWKGASGKRLRKRRVPFTKILFLTTVMHVKKCVYRHLREQKVHVEKVRANPSPFVENETSILDVTPERIFKASSINPAIRLFLYKLIYEDRSIKEREQQFGGDWDAIKDLLEDCRELIAG
jgi:hypothetical protein